MDADAEIESFLPEAKDKRVEDVDELNPFPQRGPLQDDYTGGVDEQTCEAWPSPGCADLPSGCAVDCESLTDTVASTTHLQRSAAASQAASELEVVIHMSDLSAASLRLSDAVSIISGEEINQRREALKIFSSQQSMASSIGRSINLAPSVTINYELTPFSSTISSLHPLCRICQCAAEPDNVLITPCRCDGSLRHIHATCLLKWLDISSRRHRKSGPAFCELCGYIYRKHKYIKYRDWKWPKIAVRDKVLHALFVVSLITMIGCAVATVLCFITDNEAEITSYKRNENKDLPLTKEEIITICCGITFFLSFFVSMSAEIKAKRTIYQICRKCLRFNTVWIVENYALANDLEYGMRFEAKRPPPPRPKADVPTTGTE